MSFSKQNQSKTFRLSPGLEFENHIIVFTSQPSFFNSFYILLKTRVSMFWRLLWPVMFVIHRQYNFQGILYLWIITIFHSMNSHAHQKNKPTFSACIFSWSQRVYFRCCRVGLAPRCSLGLFWGRRCSVFPPHRRISSRISSGSVKWRNQRYYDNSAHFFNRKNIPDSWSASFYISFMSIN